MRELNRKVAPTLARSPSANPALAAKDADEVDQPVIPVVASRDGKKFGSAPRGARQCRPVRAEHAILVLRCLGHRIHLVAAHDQNLTPLGGVGLAIPVELELLGGQQPGHSVCRVPPIAEVGDVVQPQISFPRAVWDLDRLERLHLPTVGIRAENTGEQNPDCGVDELVRIQPAHHRPADEP